MRNKNLGFLLSETITIDSSIWTQLGHFTTFEEEQEDIDGNEEPTEYTTGADITDFGSENVNNLSSGSDSSSYLFSTNNSTRNGQLYFRWTFPSLPKQKIKYPVISKMIRLVWRLG
jgi:hypothetical protein